MTVGTRRYKPRADQLLTDEQARHAWVLHDRGGLSIRELGRRLWQRYGYASPGSCAQALHERWKLLGLPARDRVAQVVLVTTKHGKLRRGDRCPKYLRELKVARGAVRDLRCAATKTRPGKGRGERCQAWALTGSDYCRAHDPSLKAERDAHLASMRALQQARKAAA